MPSALLVEDDGASLRSLVEWIERQGWTATAAPTLKKARAQLHRENFDLVLLDLQLPDGDGLELLEDLELQPNAEVAVLTGTATIDAALVAFRGGAVDFLTKPVDLARLRSIVAHATISAVGRAERDNLRLDLRAAGHFEGLNGISEAMQHLYDQILRVAPTDATVLIQGETGTGKELVAQAIHKLSLRKTAPFIAVNAGAISQNLIESELFGHERGSFTGAQRRHEGYFEQANGGTIFFDEVTEMPLEVQIKLLRVLESRTLQRVGGKDAISVDVRVLAATNRNPEKAVAEGRFREDLLYRLLVFPVELPPLRDRANDIELLANHFLEKLNRETRTEKRFSPEFLQALKEHPWPGNVRELKNCIRRAHIVADEHIRKITFSSIAPGPNDASDGELHFEVGTSVADASRRLILATLDHYKGDKKKAAEVLGVSLKTLYNRLNAFENS